MASIQTIVSLCILVVLVTILLASYSSYSVQKTRKQETLPWVIRSMDKKARIGHDCSPVLRFKDIELDDVEIVLTGPTCESGLPHTSDAHTISMPRSVWDSDRKDLILRHERVHILQRRNPEQWRRFYQEAWGYETFHVLPLSPESIPSEILQRIRANPDTATEPWTCWKRRYWFFPVYATPETPSLRDTEIRVWDSHTKQWTTDPPQEWKHFFCGENECPRQWEHPHEIAAEIWTNKDTSTPAGYHLLNFMEAH